jgi:D-inositol-3-phosphate glycosyltransferase
MRITIVGPLPPIRGGIAAHTLGAADEFRAHGHEVNVVGYGRIYPRWVTGARPGAGRTSTAVASREQIDCFVPSTWMCAAEEVRRRAPQMVLVQYWTPVAAAALGTLLAAVRPARRVLVCHNIDPHEPIPCASAAARWVMRRCDGAIFHSRYVHDRAIALGCDVPAAVAPVPLLITGSAEASRPPPELVAARKSGMRLFVCPGHLRRYKGIGALAAAWKRVAPAAGAVLVVAGEWLTARSEARALRRLGSRVLLIPRYLDDEEMVWLLAHADAVLLPYLAASQSGLLPTALRLARHVVVSDAGGLCESLRPGRAGGLSVAVVSPGDVAALAGALESRLKELERRVPEEPDGALRQPAPSISEGERRESWRPFVAAALRLAVDEQPPRASNSVVGGSSDSSVGDRDREQLPVAWYHARGPAR